MPEDQKSEEQQVEIVFEGRSYPVPDYSSVTFRENQLVKRVTGLRVGELKEAFETNDSDAILALFLIAKKRLDGEVDVDKLLDQRVLEFAVKVKGGEDPLAEAPVAPVEAEPAEEPSPSTLEA